MKVKKTLSIGLALALCMIAKADFTFGEPKNMEPPVNSSAYDGAPSISTAGLELYFISEPPGGNGWGDVWSDTNPPFW
jgi:hypothetical protein